MNQGQDAMPLEWQSYLEEHPSYVQAIGMISVENANLEYAMADLLSAILEIRGDVAEAVYFTPRAAFLRVEILEAAAKARYRPKEKGDRFVENEPAKAHALKDVLALVGRAKSAIGRRHEVIHDMWGVEQSSGKVIRGSSQGRQNPRRTFHAKQPNPRLSPGHRPSICLSQCYDRTPTDNG